MAKKSRTNGRARWLAAVALLLMSCSAASTDSADDTDDISEAFSDSLSLVVSGATSETCTVTGDEGVERGSGSPDAITYEVGTEDYVTVTCGELAARIAVGTDEVTLTEESTAEAENFGDLTHVPGTAMISSLMADLESQAEENIMAALSLTRPSPALLTNAEAAAIVTTSLADFMETLDDLIGGRDVANRKTQIISLLINMGVPVVIENVGSGQTLSACTDVAAATFSSDAVTADAAEVGLSGCLVYHEVFAMTDQNNPAGTPQLNNVVESLRALATESGVIAELEESFTDGRTFALSSLHSYLYDSIDYSGYTEDDEGTITTRELTTSEISSYLANYIYGNNIDSWSPADERFHTGYNPSGGWTFDTIAESFSDTVPWNAACYDSDASSLDDCPVDPIRYDFDGTALTQNDAGDYVLQLRYVSGSYTTTQKIVEYSTSRPYRDENYQPVTVDFDPSSYNTRYVTNELHTDGLDPMSDADGNSAPYSNATWRTLYPDMSLVENAYLHGASEVSARMMVIVNTIRDLDQMSALQAFAMSRLLMGAMAAFPDVDGTYIIPVDHELTVSNWEDATTTWLAAGTAVSNATGTGRILLKSGNITFPGTQKCIPSSNGRSENCTFTPVSLTYARTIGETRSNGDVTFALSGYFTVSGSAFGGPYTYTPTLLVVNSSGKKAWLEGDTDVVSYTFNGQNLINKVKNGSNTQAATTYTLLAQ